MASRGAHIPINTLPSPPPFPQLQSSNPSSLETSSVLQFLLLLRRCRRSSPLQELAAPAESAEDRNRWVVLELYEALAGRDVEAVHRLLAPDIEWWFHGPPAFQHMMRLLTGASPDEPFEFIPRSVEPLAPSTVLAEGCDASGTVVWVHAWTVSPDGVITQVREYFNTSLTVTRVGHDTGSGPVPSSKRRRGSSPNCCLPVWQSRLSESAGKSLPGLVLAI